MGFTERLVLHFEFDLVNLEFMDELFLGAVFQYRRSIRLLGKFSLSLTAQSIRLFLLTMFPGDRSHVSHPDLF
jgi:hypothetical protein